MIAFLAKGGILVVPILLCSVMALAIFFERLIRFSRLRMARWDPDRAIAAMVASGDRDGETDDASNRNNPMARVLAQAFEVRGQDRETVRTVLAHATAAEVRELARYIPALATIGNIATAAGTVRYGSGDDQGLYGHPADGRQGERGRACRRHLGGDAHHGPGTGRCPADHGGPRLPGHPAGPVRVQDPGRCRGVYQADGRRMTGSFRPVPRRSGAAGRGHGQPDKSPIRSTLQGWGS